MVYDIDRADILIKYINKETLYEIADRKRITVAANKKYSVDVPKYIADENGLGYNYLEGTETNILVKKDIINEVNLYYTEAKAPVTIRYKNEDGIKLCDDVVELVQIGKKYLHDFEKELTDFSCREWKLKSSNDIEIIVNKDKEKNIIEAIYEPVLANVTIKFVNTDNRAIKNPKTEKAQIGEVFNSESLDEIIDNFGKAWKCISEGEKIVVQAKEIQNEIVLKYEPLMAKVTIRYLDTEMNELMESKMQMLQVGTEYKEKPIESFEAKDGKRWKIDFDKIESIIVKKHEEENIHSMYYEKENSKVKLAFYDAYGNELKESIEIESQIGAEASIKTYEKIIATDGGRWMIESTEPKNLTIKEKDNFIKLIYGEMQANVLIKFLDIKTEKPIKENMLIKVKLGGIYMPNIQEKILDKNKYRWKYIGDEGISIVTKENEEENIIALNYDEDKAKVILKYLNENGEKIREDAIKEVQIGKKIELNPIQKFVDNNGLTWKHKNIKMDGNIVEEKDNTIYMIYEPLMSDVAIKYVNSENENIIKESIIKIQVGKEFSPEIIDRVTDENGKVWIYDKISNEKIIVKEEENEIIMIFEKLEKNIYVNLVDEESNLIAEPIIYKNQVGEEFVVPYENRYVDKEDKAWILNKVDKEKIITREDEEKNIINIFYKKELIDVIINYYDDNKNIIRDQTTEKVQIGSIYKPLLFKEIIDEKTNFGWKLPDNFILEHKVNRESKENVLTAAYEKLNVNIFVKYKEKNGAEIIDQTLYNGQVGTEFIPKIENVIIDKEEKEWLYGETEETRFFVGTKNKIETITIDRNEEKNIINLAYRPSLIGVTIKYQETLGNQIKEDKIVDAQIGSVYEAEIIEVLQDKNKIKWVYNPNSNSKIKVGHEEKENVIVLSYEEEKALVTYKYQDEYGNRLRSPKRKLVQIGTIYKPEVENIIEDYQNRVWEYKAKSVDKLEIKDDESINVIEVIYKPLKVDATLRFLNPHKKQLMKERTVKAQLGSEFSPKIEEKITDEESKLFKFVKCNPEKIKITEVPVGALESPNTFELTYEPVFSDVIVKYKTIDGEKIKDDFVVQMQVGLLYEPQIAQYIKNEEGIEWELITKEIEPIRVKEDSRENIISMVYEVAKTEVTIRYKDIMGNNILKSDIIPIEVGREFIPEIKNEVLDESGKKWVFSSVEPVKLTVGSINNIITVTYAEKKAQVIVKYHTNEGKVLKEDFKTKIQIGTKYEPQNVTKVIYDENEIWRFSHNEPSVIIISENVSENVITQVYSKEDKKEEIKTKNNTYYNPEIEKFIDKDLVEKAKEEEIKNEQKIKEEEKFDAVVFEDANLKRLEKGIALTNEEKNVIKKLNDLNKEIINYLNEEMNKQSDDVDLENKLNQKTIAEKKIIEEELIPLLKDDKTGKKLLKIIEAIIETETLDQSFSMTGRKKAIAVTDYFINKQITEIEQANYICDKGIIEKSIECVKEKISFGLNNVEEYKKIKVILIYEKVILNNYNKARSKVKDEYFKNSESKELVAPEIVIIVANNMPKQAYNLLLKLQTLSIQKENELEAIIKLLNTQQLGTLMTMVEKIPDGKMRKIVMKKLKEIIK